MTPRPSSRTTAAASRPGALGRRTPLLGAAALSLLVGGATCLLSGAAPLAAQSPHGSSMTGQVVEGEDFLVYDEDGRARSFAHVLAALDEAEAVLVGESHDDPVGHGVEAQLLVRAAERFGVLGEGAPERPVVLSLEMFERDVQYILDEYLLGLISEDQFLESARPWDWYRTDYRPLVEFARAHDLPVVAANAPRRYVNRVTRLGPASLEELSEEARAFLPPLPYPGPSERYRAEWDRLMEEMMAEMTREPEEGEPEEEEPDEEEAEEEAPAHPMPEEEMPAHPVPEEEVPGAAPPTHSMDYALDAQALWDAAMGEAVARALERRPGALVLHFAGSFHVARGTGIPERVPEYRPGTRILTVVLRPAEDIRAWDDEVHRGLADFVILTDERPRPSPHAP